MSIVRARVRSQWHAVRVVSVNMTTHSDIALSETPAHGEKRMGTLSGVLAFIHVDLWKHLQNVKPANEISGRGLALVYGTSPNSFVDVIIYQVSGTHSTHSSTASVRHKANMAASVERWTHQTLTKHKQTKVNLMGDFQQGRGLHEIALSNSMHHTSAQHGRHVPTYTPGGVEVSTIDHLYESHHTTRSFCATATNCGNFSATHRALLFSFKDDILQQTTMAPLGTTPPVPCLRMEDDSSIMRGPQRWHMKTYTDHKAGQECPKLKCPTCTYTYQVLAEPWRLAIINTTSQDYNPHPGQTLVIGDDTPEHQREAICTSGDAVILSVVAQLVSGADEALALHAATLRDANTSHSYHNSQKQKKSILAVVAALTRTLPVVCAGSLSHHPTIALDRSIFRDFAAMTAAAPNLPGIIPPPPSNPQLPHDHQYGYTKILKEWVHWSNAHLSTLKTKLVALGLYQEPSGRWVEPPGPPPSAHPPTTIDRQRAMSSKGMDGPLDGLLSPNGEWVTDTKDLHKLHRVYLTWKNPRL